VTLSYNLDPAFAGFDVIVEKSAPEVATALEQRLGSVVRVTLGEPDLLHRR
jgi:hypothetical protein